jgi:hypothetical protein
LIPKISLENYSWIQNISIVDIFFIFMSRSMKKIFLLIEDEGDNFQPILEQPI